MQFSLNKCTVSQPLITPFEIGTLFLAYTDSHIEPTVSPPFITVSGVGSAESPQFTIRYGPFTTELGILSTFQIVVIESSDDIDTARFGRGSLLPKDRTPNK